MVHTQTTSPTPQDILSHGCYDCLNRYAIAKLDNPGAIILVRVGDFYESYGDDARVMAIALGLTLGSKETGSSAIGRIKLTGIPYYSVRRYVEQLQDQGYQVVLVERRSRVTTIKSEGVIATNIATLGVATLGAMKLTGAKGMKALAYHLASQVLGVQISNTKQLKKFFSAYDFRRKQSWIDVVTALQNRLAIKELEAEDASGKAA